jgi:hypothetical protein
MGHRRDYRKMNFYKKYRMHRESFKHLVQSIEDHPVFHTDVKKEQAPVTHQLLLFRHYLGKSGSGANNLHLHNMFQIIQGTSKDFKRHRIKAI